MLTLNQRVVLCVVTHLVLIQAQIKPKRQFDSFSPLLSNHRLVASYFIFSGNFCSVIYKKPTSQTSRLLKQIFKQPSTVLFVFLFFTWKSASYAIEIERCRGIVLFSLEGARVTAGASGRFRLNLDTLNFPKQKTTSVCEIRFMYLFIFRSQIIKRFLRNQISSSGEGFI